MTVFLFLLLVSGALAAFAVLATRIEGLRREIADLRDRIAVFEGGDGVARAPVADPEPRRASARIVAPPPPVVTAPAPEFEPDPPAAPRPPRRRVGFEQLVGGKLPIWIGGAALVLAGFFLVRYSIELGLLGPVARTVIAALFGLALVAASEPARRHRLTRDDPRIAQALAGAGIASLYGTLYVGAALYHLIGAGTAFVLLLFVTLGALGLALRHGPPTAIMALVGGFVAPLVAGIDATGVGPLLVYLALLVAALFGLAIRRSWTWLALAACGGGFLWVNLLIALVSADKLPGVGAFVLLLAIGATLALPATGAVRRWLRLAPLVVGLVQLMVLAPALDFGPLAWGFYLVLSAAALALAIRDETLAPGPAAALLLVLLLLAIALDRGDADAPAAALVAALLFGAAGHWRARRAPLWAGIALAATAGPLLLVEIEAHALLAPAGWAALLLVAMAAAGSLGWRARDDAPPVARAGGGGVATLLACAIAVELLPTPWHAAGLALVAAAAWGLAVPLAELALVATAAAVLPQAFAMLHVAILSLGGERLPYLLLPPLPAILRELALPAALVAAALLYRPYRLSRFVWPAVALAAVASVYALAKAPLAIATPAGFVAWGFAERAVITQLFFLAAWALRDRLPLVARILFWTALARIAWFDLVLLDPLWVRQSVGALPFANAATVGAGLTAWWLWQRRTDPRWAWAGLATLLVALLVTVRQLTHGAILTGPVWRTENWLYSAAGLALALVWLSRGIAAGAADLRLAGLALLTLVTLKVFLIDAAALEGMLRILSFLGLGVALIGIGWAYGRMTRAATPPEPAP
ncbi:MAG TPA: DUF2339 domain-containing protein [Sphingomonas sp.]|nr:DUF2339 domain-containing protein [Sphingomonas sp.]